MNIYPYTSYNYHKTSQIKKSKYSSQPTFSGPNNNLMHAEKRLRSIEYFFRVIGNKIMGVIEPASEKRITKTISEIKPKSDGDYLEALYEIGRHYGTSKVVDVNSEDKILEKIAAEGKSTIFIMNHSNQAEDPSMVATLNCLLADAYAEFGRFKGFPLPKIILNEDILTSMSRIKRKAYEVAGAVGIDAAITSRDNGKNGRILLPIIKDFIEDKCNIFIFPEGRLAVRKNLDLEERFQPGVAELVNKILGIKKEVTVVPVGFAYGKGKSKTLTGMHIGTPIRFKREGEVTTVTSGSVPKSEFACEEFLNFFSKYKNITDIPIKKRGEHVKPREVGKYIKSILSENLNICSLEAKERIQH